MLHIESNICHYHIIWDWFNSLGIFKWNNFRLCFCHCECYVVESLFLLSCCEVYWLFSSVNRHLRWFTSNWKLSCLWWWLRSHFRVSSVCLVHLWFRSQPEACAVFIQNFGFSASPSCRREPLTLWWPLLLWALISFTRKKASFSVGVLPSTCHEHGDSSYHSLEQFWFVL